MTSSSFPFSVLGMGTNCALKAGHRRSRVRVSRREKVDKAGLHNLQESIC